MAHGETINSRMLAVINLDPSVIADDLYTHFESVGEVIWAKVRDKSIPKHVYQGYISYAKPEDADNAIAKLDGSVIKGKAIRVAKSSFSFNKLTVAVSNEVEDLKPDKHFEDIFKEFGPLVATIQFVHQAGERYLNLYYEEHQGAARAAAALTKGRFHSDHMFLSCFALVDPLKELEELRQADIKLIEDLKAYKALTGIELVYSSSLVASQHGGESASSQMPVVDELKHEEIDVMDVAEENLTA